MIQTRSRRHLLACLLLCASVRSTTRSLALTAHVPCEVEAKHYLYGFPSKPSLPARSNPDVWMKPTGMEAYLKPKLLWKRTSSLRSARAARRRSCLWGRPRSRAAAKQSSLRLLISSSTSTSSRGVWRLLRRWRKLRCIKLTLRTTWRGRRRPLRLKKSCSTTSPGTGRTKLYQ